MSSQKSKPPPTGMAQITSFFKKSPASTQTGSPTSTAPNSAVNSPAPSSRPAVLSSSGEKPAVKRTSPLGENAAVDANKRAKLDTTEVSTAAPSPAAAAAAGAPPASSSVSASSSSSTSSSSMVKPTAPSAVDDDSDDDDIVAVSRLRKVDAQPSAAAASSSSSSATKPTVKPAVKAAAAPKSKAPAASKGRRSGDSDDDDDADEEEDDDVSSDDDDDGFIEDDDDDDAPKSKKKPAAASSGAKRKRAPAKAAAAPRSAAAASKSAPAGDAEDEEGDDAGGSGALSHGQHTHWKWKFWQLGHIKDAAGRRADHPDYDRRTLSVPPDVFKDASPAKKQWWTWKAANFDTLLFFRQGKFYETFHMDADVLVAEGIAVYMKGAEAHAGLPERSFGKESEKLRRRGYRIARIEQTETPEENKKRTGKATAGVVRRELCGIKSAGITLGSHLDVMGPAWGADGSGIGLTPGASSTDASALTAPTAGDPVYYTIGSGDIGAGAGTGPLGGGAYLLALCEVPIDSPSPSSSSAAVEFDDEGGGASAFPAPDDTAASDSYRPHGFVRFGAALADTSTGSIRVAEWIDDSSRILLRTLLQRYPVAELLSPGPTITAAPASSSASSSSSLSSSAAATHRPARNWAGFSSTTARILCADAAGAREEVLAPGREFWSALETAEQLTMLPYIRPGDVVADASSVCPPVRLPGRLLLRGSGGVAASSSSAAAAAGKKGPVSGGSKEAEWAIPAWPTDGDVRLCDYFNNGSMFDASPASSSSPSAKGAAAAIPPPPAPPSCRPVRFFDGVERFVPAVLVDVLDRAKAEGYTTPSGYPSTSSSSSVSDAPEGEGGSATSSLTALTTRSSGGGGNSSEPMAHDVPASSLALSAFGALVWSLRRALVDNAVLSLRRVNLYRHADGSDANCLDSYHAPSSSSSASSSSSRALASSGGDAAAAALDDNDSGKSSAAATTEDAAVDTFNAGDNEDPASALHTLNGVRSRAYGEGDASVPHMYLDGTTLLNLEVLENGDGGRKGTLLSVIDRTVTPFGRRRFRQWLVSPLLRPEDIDDRLNAVEDLLPLLKTSVATALAKLRKLPDLERLLARVHSLGSSVGAKDHPDSRAVFYENELYSKRRINDLSKVLDSFNTLQDVRDLFHVPNSTTSSSSRGELIPDVSSPMLRRVLHDSFPDMRGLLDHFSRSYSKKGDSIVPAMGSDPAYDAALTAVSEVEGELDAYLRTQRTALNCRDLAFYHGAKDRYHLEVPEAVAGRIPSSAGYEVKSKKKGSGKKPGVWRYTTSDSEHLVARLTSAETRRDDLVKDSLRRLFERFDSHAGSWRAAVSCIATLDCVASLASFSAGSDGRTMCRPVIVHPPPPSSGTTGGEPGPFLHLTAARHPCMPLGLFAASDATFIPNDVVLGRSGAADNNEMGGPACVLLTGPNMGGKSTWMRMASTCALLAQLGAYVPAEACRMTPVDRIFTRVGASDRLLAGMSTFFVELAETSAILRHATRHSLVLLDELGRGTSTFDGAAIAYAVTKHVTEKVGCRTMFATHYHTLCDDFSTDPRVALGHMGCHVEKGDDGVAKVTFLYQYQAGACPKSYGLHVANLAKLPASIVARAKQKSEEFEAAVAAAEGRAATRLSFDELYDAAKSRLMSARGGEDEAALSVIDDTDCMELYEAAVAAVASS